MRFKLTLLLIIANLVTFGFIWKNSSGNSATEISALSLFSADISSVSVRSNAPDASYTLSKAGTTWVVEKPFAWNADIFAVNRLLSELRFLDSSFGFSVEEVAEAGNTLSSYGLEKPFATVTVTDSAGKHELRIGKTTPDNRSVYVLSPDEDFIIPAPISLLNAIGQTPDELRVHDIFGLRPFEVRAVTVRTTFSGGAEQRIGLAKTRIHEDGNEKFTWNFETPISAAADSQLVEQRIKDLAQLTYTRFVSGDTPPDDASGLKSPVLRFTLEAANRTRTLLVGNSDPTDPKGETRFAKLEDNPAIFTVPAKTVIAWSNAARELRDPYFLRFDPATLSAITIHEGRDALVLHRVNRKRTSTDSSTEDVAASESLVGTITEPRPEILETQSGADANPLYNAWKMPVAPGSLVTSARNVDPSVIAELIESLLNLKATRAPGADDTKFSAAQRRLCEAFVADSATPEDIAQMKFNTPLRLVELEFTDADGKIKTQTLTIAPAVEPNTPLHAKTGTAIYSITPEILKALNVSPYHFRSRNVYSLPAGGKIVSLKLSEIDAGKETLLLEEKCPDGTEDWENALESDSAIESQALAKLIHATSNVVAESYLPVPFSRDFTDSSYLDMDVPEGWHYKLEVTVLLADGEKNSPGKTETMTYYLTRRLGGTTQIAGAPAQDCVFKIQQGFIDAMHTLTFNRSGIVPEIEIPEPAPTESIVPQN